MKFKGKYLTKRSFEKALREYHAQQMLRSPTFEGDWAKNCIGKRIQEADHIFIGGEPITGNAGWHGRVIKQGRSGRAEDLLLDKPFVKIFYKNGQFSIKVDRAKLNELGDTAKLYVEDPKLVYEKVKNKIADKYAEKQYLRDAAIFR